MIAPQAIVLKAPGTNRDQDVSQALVLAGAIPRITLLDELIEQPELLSAAQLLVIAGGFSHADALGAGRLFALRLMHAAGEQMQAFIEAGKPVIGICNGFQVLTSAGLLPGALGHNDSGLFQCRWVTLDAPSSSSVWTTNIQPIDCPIAHGEGRFVHDDVHGLAQAGQVALTYRTNPNGSMADIAGVCDASGVVLGLMPHPENHILTRQHPLHRSADYRPGVGLGLQLFHNGVHYAAQ